MKRIFFHSYKGGVGRTFILANTAFDLCQQGYRVGVVDLDYDAPGLAHIMFNSVGCEFKSKEKDLIYLLTNYSPGSINEAIIELQPNLFALPTNPSQSRRMDPLYELALNPDGLLDERLELTLKAFGDAAGLDYVLVDLRPGYSFLLTSLFTLADMTIQVFRLAKQDIYGTKTLATAFAAKSKESSLLMPSFVPMGLANYKDILNDVINNNFPNSNINSEYFIPVVNELFVDDRILSLNTTINNRSLAMKQMLKTTQFILKRITNA